jgi:regulator of replication initiation timing
MSDMQEFERRAEVAERELEELSAEISALKSGAFAADEELAPEELVRLRLENSKLKYRIGILRRAAEAEAEKK